MHNIVMLIYHINSFIMSNITICLHFSQIESLGKFINQSNNIFYFVFNLSHNFIILLPMRR